MGGAGVSHEWWDYSRAVPDPSAVRVIFVHRQPLAAVQSLFMRLGQDKGFIQHHMLNIQVQQIPGGEGVPFDIDHYAERGKDSLQLLSMLQNYCGDNVSNVNYQIVCVSYEQMFEPDVQRALQKALGVPWMTHNLMAKKPSSGYSISNTTRRRLKVIYAAAALTMTRLGAIHINRAKGYTAYARQAELTAHEQAQSSGNYCSVIEIEQATLVVKTATPDPSAKPIVVFSSRTFADAEAEVVKQLSSEIRSAGFQVYRPKRPKNEQELQIERRCSQHWLKTWVKMLRRAKRSRGCVLPLVQVRSDTFVAGGGKKLSGERLSAMQRIEMRISRASGVRMCAEFALDNDDGEDGDAGARVREWVAVRMLRHGDENAAD